MNRLRRMLVAVPVVALLAGCSAGSVYDLPLPGGADLGSDPYTVTVQFQDVLDLVPKSMVKVDGVEVGQVDAVNLSDTGWLADVVIKLPKDVTIAKDATFTLQQTSLLGEKYISINQPTDGVKATALAADSVVPVARTDRGVEVEEVLGALSAVLNGGSLEQIRTISREVNAALAGNETQVRGLLDDVNTFVGGLDEQKSEIVRALDSLDRLSGQLRGRTAQISDILENIGPGLQVLESQRTELVGMLSSLNRLSDVGVSVINRSQADLVGDLRRLSPTLNELSASATDIAKSLSVLPTYPFEDNFIKAEQGSYVDGYIRVSADLTDILGNFGRSQQPVIDPGLLGGPQAAGVPQPAPASPGTIPLLPVPALPGTGGAAPGGAAGTAGGARGLVGTLLGGN